MEHRHILVLGAGSVGKRHLRNFHQLGCTVSAMDPRVERLEEAGREVPLAYRFTSLDSIITHRDAFTGVAVCSPPKFHVSQAETALRMKLPVFLEKPVSPDLASASRLRDAVVEAGVPLLLGYTYRWWIPLQELKARVDAGAVGTVRHVRCVMSAHLADWHPWERYQDFFMASRELGGGALLDESHFIDLILWMFGMPDRVFATVEKLSQLEIDTDDNVDALLLYDQGLRVSIHLDLYGRPHEKYITVVGDMGTLHWSFDPNQIRQSGSAGPEWSEEKYEFQRNDMFVIAAREFLQVLGGRAVPTCTIDDGVKVLQIIEAMRQSSLIGALVAVK